MANVENTPWWKCKNYMESCYMRLWPTQTDDHTSLAWKPCSEFSTTVLTFHAPRPDKSLLISTGGPPNSPNQPSEEVSQQHTVRDIAAFSDASSSTGIAIIIGTRWKAWKLLPGWDANHRNIGWAEAVGFKLLVRTIARLSPTDREEHFETYGDNQGVVEGWKGGRSRNPRINEVFKRVTNISRDANIVVHTKYVRSARNPADDPSRGIYPPESLLPPLDIPHELRAFIVDYNHPSNDGELPHNQPRATVRPKPNAGEWAKRSQGDDTLNAIARRLYQAKTTLQYNQLW